MSHRHTKASCALWAALLLASAACLAAPARDSDGDGITDQNETVLGTDPEYAEQLTLICDDGAKGEGDKSYGRALSPSRDATKIWSSLVWRSFPR